MTLRALIFFFKMNIQIEQFPLSQRERAGVRENRSINQAVACRNFLIHTDNIVL